MEKSLYLKGMLPNPKIPRVAVIGTRQITPYGRRATQFFTHELVKAGFVIVSGLMYGVDMVAHEACITAGGKTIAVLGYGFDAPYYPKQAEKVATRILQSGGCLVSQFEPHTRAVPENFPRRNQTIVDLSLGVLVTEATPKSGSLLTARLAAESGKEVFAVPGPFDSPYSEGTKELVNLGAKLVTSVRDILEELKS